MIEVAALRTARVAVVGLEVSTGQPPAIVQAAVYHVDGGTITADPYCFWTDPDVPLYQVRVSSWQNVRLAPPWPQVAERVTVAIGDRILAVHDRHRLDIIRRHLPDWQPAGVIVTRELAEQTWPGLTDYSLNPAGASGEQRGAAAEAHTTALLLGTLLDDISRPRRTRPPHQTRRTNTGRPEQTKHTTRAQAGRGGTGP